MCAVNIAQNTTVKLAILSLLVSIILLSLSLFFSQNAQAFFHKSDVDECMQDTGVARIKGCSALIKSRRAFGQPISNANLAKAYFNRGLAYHNRARHKRAVTDFKASLKLRPKYKRAQRYLAQSQAAIGAKSDTLPPTSVKEATSPTKRPASSSDTKDDVAPEIDTISPKGRAATHKKRGLVYNEEGKYHRAITQFTKALKLAPDDAMTYNARGLTYENMNKFDRAIADYQKALKLDPTMEIARKNLKALGVEP